MFDRIRKAWRQIAKATLPHAIAPKERVAEWLATYLREYRRSLMRGAITGKFARQAKVARRRFARSKTQKLARLLRAGGRPPPLPRSMLLNRFRPSPILDALTPGREGRWVPVLKRPQEADIPEVELHNFSIIDHPRETMSAIKRLAEISEHSLLAQLHFEDSHCTDISPYLILAEVWPAMSHVYRGGRISTPIAKVIEAVRLRSPLGMKFLNVSEQSDVWAFPLHRRRPSKISRSVDRDLRPQTREKVADGFCDAVDVWLGVTANHQLTPEGKARFASLIGELLDNAERHSDLSKDGSWSIAAFMARRVEDAGTVFRCYMAFLSEGVSIAESLQTAAPAVLAEVNRYCDQHSSRTLSRATLSTLMALQDTITRDSSATAESRGGIGLQDVLDFVSHFSGDTPAKLTIVSGRSCIQLRAPYIMGKKAGLQEPRLLWCNPANRSDDPPDPAFVFDLADHFAGTIVGLSFVLDPDHLKRHDDA